MNRGMNVIQYVFYFSINSHGVVRVMNFVNIKKKLSILILSVEEGHGDFVSSFIV